MKHFRPPRDLWASLLPTLGSALALAVAYQFQALDPGSRLSPGLLLVVVLAGVAGACHRPAAGSATLGLGAMVLPVSLLLDGAAPTALLAAAVLLVAELLLRLVRRFAQVSERRGILPRTLESTGRAILSTLAAGGLWVWLRPGWSVPAAVAAAAGVYLLLWVGLEAADRKIRRPDQPPRLGNVLFPLGVDAIGWLLGGILGMAGQAAGWTLGGALLAVCALLVLEASRNALLRDKAQSRVRDLERLHRASRRMGTPQQEMDALAGRIRVECSRVIPSFSWFHFEALSPGSEFKSWWWGPRSEELEEGVPMPERHPPALPGFHRRTQWQILERQLRSRPEGEVLGRIRLWCDPRRLDPQHVELLDRLLPQMTLSVQRCLLDRQANEDPLTGVAMRRVLEKRLHEGHARCHEEGGAMAVLLCDLDFFKRINDTYGHPAGDAALVAVAGVLKETCRVGDLCCRYGGEEFVLLMEQTNGEGGLAVAERLRQAIEELDFQVEGNRVPLTLSAGIASFPELYIKTGAELLLFADEALYEAKRRGRNRVLLDIGQGRYLDVEGSVLTSEDTPPPVQEPPRIFA